jgi:hypothetical protein
MKTTPVKSSVMTRQESQIAHHTLDQVVSRQISKQGLYHLCCALQDELDVYASLVLAAANLNETTKTQTLNELATLTCPVESLSELRQVCGQQ